MPRRTVIRRHVLRNALLPTIAVVATQIGYLFGGLVAIEKFFGYPGIGSLILTAAQIKNFPMLQACVLVVGDHLLRRDAARRHPLAALNPRVRAREGLDERRRPGIAIVPVLAGRAAPETSLDSQSRVRRETIKQLVHSPTFLIGVGVMLFWVVCAFFGDAIAPHDPIDDSLGAGYAARRRRRTGSASTSWPRRVLARDRRRARHPRGRARSRRCSASRSARCSASSWATSAAGSTT